MLSQHSFYPVLSVNSVNAFKHNLNENFIKAIQRTVAHIFFTTFNFFPILSTFLCTHKKCMVHNANKWGNLFFIFICSKYILTHKTKSIIFGNQWKLKTTWINVALIMDHFFKNDRSVKVMILAYKF